jgi:drug/metabolite transporter (DMT)-like permease
LPPFLVRLVPVLFVLLWATGFIGARYAMPWAEPFTFLGVRFALAAAILALLILILRSRRLDPRIAMHSVIAGTLIHGVYLGAVFWAIANGMPAGMAALIMGLQPLITALLAGAFLGEAVSGRHWVGLAIGLFGVVLVLVPGMDGSATSVTTGPLAACMVAVAAISAGTVWQKKFATGADLATGTLYQYLGGATLMLLAAFAFETGRYTLNGELIFAMAWLVLVLSIGAVFLLMYLIRLGEMSKVSSLFYLVPGVTAVMAWALFGETLGALQLLGLAITTAGVALATQSVTRARASR